MVSTPRLDGALLLTGSMSESVKKLHVLRQLGLTQFGVILQQKCCNWQTVPIVWVRRDPLFQIWKKSRLFPNHAFSRSTNSYAFAFQPQYSLATGPNGSLYFLNFLKRITLCCLALRSHIPSHLKIAFYTGLVAAGEASKPLCCNWRSSQEKHADCWLRTSWVVRSQRKTMERQRSVER